MKRLNDELDVLRELDKHRFRAKELLKQSLRPLRTIRDITKGRHNEPPTILKRKIEYKGKKERPFEFKDWTSSGNTVETALLAKIQNHGDLCEHDEDNNSARASNKLINRLAKMDLKENLMQPARDEGRDINKVKSVPVIKAARAMQVLTSRSETTFSRASMICHYRIIRELYGAAPPDWTVGAARAGTGGKTSAFVTAECIRAILTFRNTVQRTAIFFRETKKLLERYENLSRMIKGLEANEFKDHPLRFWADKTMEAMWLDWFLSTNQRKGQPALFYNDNAKKYREETYDWSNVDDLKAINLVSDSPNLLFDLDSPKGAKNQKVNVEIVGNYFKTLEDILENSLKEASVQVKFAFDVIEQNRRDELNRYLDPSVDNSEKDKYERSMSAHHFAQQRVEAIDKELEKALKIIASNQSERNKKIKKLAKALDKSPLEIEYLKNILDQIAKLCEENTSGLNRIAAPTRQYIKTVIRRELSNPDSMFDAGELVFAASTYGAMTEWKQPELLKRACEKLVNALPESGRFLTKRPLHTSITGYRMLPIGCEMSRSLAFLLCNMNSNFNYEFDPQLVERMLNIFEENLITLYKDSYEKNTFIGWNFDSSPDQDKPCVWVSSVAVLALDQVVRMLNSRINRGILPHFETIMPEKPHTDLPINELIFTDYGFEGYYYKKFPEEYSKLQPIPIHLELMRAHVMRASLPESYSYENDEKVYSAILYGPPGTGKTTLAEVLAYNSEQPLIKLSPSDLNVQGESLIESRARDVFEALSMLTQTVIIFDEFEPLVQTRLSEVHNEEKTKVNGAESVEPLIAGLDSVASELKMMSMKDDPRLRFLLAGMLPKFLKLHDAARAQSLVYLGATNALKDIDAAAKRPGRFDLKIPIYHPCPLSRAGTLLYRLSKSTKTSELDLFANRSQLERFLNVVVATVNEPASDLAQIYFNEKRSNYINYILSGRIHVSKIKKANDKIEKMRTEKTRRSGKLEELEKDEYEWLIDFEQHIFDRVCNFANSTDGNIEFLKACLTGKRKKKAKRKNPT